jgi:hypothetical protein
MASRCARTCAVFLAILSGCVPAAPPPSLSPSAMEGLRSSLNAEDMRSPLFGEFFLYALCLDPGGRGPAHKAARERLAAVPAAATTFAVALRAMALASLDAAAHRADIEESLRLLVASQSGDGGWAYDAVRSGPTPAFNSRNCVAHFAGLGLEACARAGLEVPRPTLERARAHWIREQNPDGGWGCCGAKASAGSMTAGALTAMVAFDRRLGIDPASDAAVVAGLRWLRENRDLSNNPGLEGRWHLYWLWSLVLLECELPPPLRPDPLWSSEVRDFLTEGKPFDTSCCGAFDPKIDLAFMASIQTLLGPR